MSLLLLAACTDSGLKAVNAEPTASITSHADGDEVDAGVPIEFRGVVGDPDGISTSLVVNWYLDNVAVCAAVTPAEDGSTACEITVAGETATVALEVTDASHAAATDTVSLTSCTGAWYADLDGDTFGDATNTSSACTQPTGYVADGTDCDDYDASANPALPETCGDLVDNDCDGHADEGCLGTNCFDDDDVIDNLSYYQTLGSLRDTDALDDAGSYQDDFEFQGVAGSELAFHVWSEDVDAAVSVYDPDCELYDEASDGARGTNPFLQVRIPTDGIWTVVVHTDTPAGLGTYVFEAIDDSPVLGANCGLNTYTLDVLTDPYEDNYTGSLQSGDQLWGSDVGEGFYFDDAELYSFYGDSLDLTEASDAFDPVMSLFDPTCSLVTYDTDSGGGTTARIQSDITRTGIYTVVPWGTWSYSTGAYTVTAAASF
jgi:hypothetical protein